MIRLKSVATWYQKCLKVDWALCAARKFGIKAAMVVWNLCHRDLRVKAIAIDPAVLGRIVRCTEPTSRAVAYADSLAAKSAGVQFTKSERLVAIVGDAPEMPGRPRLMANLPAEGAGERREAGPRTWRMMGMIRGGAAKRKSASLASTLCTCGTA